MLAHETLSHKLSSTANPECVLVLSNLMWLTHLITDSALVPQRSATLDAVDPFLVLPQVDELVEGLAAGGAGERRGARVGEGVARQELALQEGAAAHDAGEAALGHVQPQVPLELVLHRELLGAVRAREVADAVDVRAEVPLLGSRRALALASLFISALSSGFSCNFTGSCVLLAAASRSPKQMHPLLHPCK